VLATGDGDTALQLWKAKHPSFVLLDIDLPKVNGWEICKTIRAESAVPIIMLTASVSEADVVKGLDAGADDYMVKPFSPRVLTARIRAAQRRTDHNRAHQADMPRLGISEIVLNPEWHTVERAGETIRLTTTQFKLLHELVQYAGQVLTHERLVDRIWGYAGVDDRSILKGHIHNLRSRLEPDPANPIYVKTVPGIGYTFPRSAQPV
jgi:DNA-binding response OmpR family regulator